MERKDNLVSAEELARQKEYMRKVRAMNDVLTRAPTALVDTFGCQQNVADGERLAGMLTEMGYERCEQVEAPGQYAVRGGIVDHLLDDRKICAAERHNDQGKNISNDKIGSRSGQHGSNPCAYRGVGKGIR